VRSPCPEWATLGRRDRALARVSLCCAVAAGALLAPSAAAWATGPYTFALVPKSTNNPFYDQALAGCKKAEAELKGAIKCLYVGPNEHGGGGEQAQIVGDLITKKVDGIAVSPANAAAIAAALQGAKAANIPIITWDSDLLEKDKGLRATYIGAHNYDIGVNLAKLVMEAKPKGGTLRQSQCAGAPPNDCDSVDRPCGRPWLSSFRWTTRSAVRCTYRRKRSNTCLQLRNTGSAYTCVRGRLASAGGWSLQAQCALETPFKARPFRLAR
jgi:Periplasmic binding protein domain